MIVYKLLIMYELNLIIQINYKINQEINNEFQNDKKKEHTGRLYQSETLRRS